LFYVFEETPKKEKANPFAAMQTDFFGGVEKTPEKKKINPFAAMQTDFFGGIGSGALPPAGGSKKIGRTDSQIKLMEVQNEFEEINFNLSFEQMEENSKKQAKKDARKMNRVIIF